MGIIQESKSKILLCSCLAPVPFLQYFLLWEETWVHDFCLEPRRKCYDAAFLEIYSGQAEQAGLKNVRKYVFPVWRKWTKVSSQVLHLEAVTGSIAEWDVPRVAIFRPSVYFWILVTDNNSLRAQIDAAGCQVVLCNATRLWWFLYYL